MMAHIPSCICSRFFNILDTSNFCRTVNSL